MSETPTQPAPNPGEDRTAAILSYLTIVGFIVALILHSNRKTQLGAFHLRQSLGLLLTGVAFSFGAIVLAFIPFIGWLAVLAGWIGLFVLVVMGFVSAINGKQTPVPLLGEKYQQWLGGAFN